MFIPVFPPVTLVPQQFLKIFNDPPVYQCLSIIPPFNVKTESYMQSVWGPVHTYLFSISNAIIFLRFQKYFRPHDNVQTVWKA